MESGLRQKRWHEFANGTFYPDQIRKSIIFSTVFLYDIFTAMALLTHPYREFDWQLLRIPILLLHLFALWIMLSPEKRQKEAMLYMGLLGLVGSLTDLYLLPKLMCTILGVSFPLYTYSLIILYLASAYLMVQSTPRFIDEGGYSNKTPGLPSGFLSFVYAVGVLFVGHVVLGIVCHNIGVAIFGGLMFVLLEICLLMAVIGLFKYILIRQHPEWYKWKK